MKDEGPEMILGNRTTAMLRWMRESEASSPSRVGQRGWRSLLVAAMLTHRGRSLADENSRDITWRHVEVDTEAG